MTPVTVVTGFLGSGKTTLICALLRSHPAEKIAVIVNEIGDIALDDQIVEYLADDVALLASGCLCCTQRLDARDSLERLLARRAAGELPAFDRVVIETSGMSDPAPAVQAAGMYVSDVPTRLDGVVATLDAVVGAKTLASRPEARRQVAMADRIVLTKCDLADVRELNEARLAARKLNSVAEMTSASHGEGAGVIFGASLYSQRDAVDPVRWLSREEMVPHAGAHDVLTHGAQIDGALDWPTVSTWLDALTAVLGDALLRFKGIFFLRGESRPVAVHAVRHVLHPPVRLPSWGTRAPQSRLMIVAEGLQRSLLQDLVSALARAGEGAALTSSGSVVDSGLTA
ncbi:MAG: GTP-binding protein [Xanthomonadaceae bacterium]|nr:GTP-binding protein [Xanthomonadaceae bacterium]